MPEIEYANTALLSDGHSKGITSIAFNADGTLLATSGLDGAVCVWDTKTWSIQDIYYAKTPVTSLAWFTENALVCGLQDGILSMLVKDGAVSVTGFWASVCPIEHLRFSDNLLACGAQRELTVWHWQADRESYMLPAADDGDSTDDNSTEGEDVEVLVTGVFWAPSMLIVTYLNHGIRLVDTETWTTVKTIQPRYSIAAASLSPNGVYLAVSTLSSGFAIYDLETSKVFRKFKSDVGEEQRAIPVLFVHGGHAIVGGSAVGRVNIWFIDSERKLPSLRTPSTYKCSG
ncbi:WD40-repeat-containing domain protein [Daedaleopsis nitida]|nr:WD40-repeat-containing domain protein [Daedaleopsis nitida]